MSPHCRARRYANKCPWPRTAVTAGLNINAQRFVDPRRFVEALGRSVVDRGATMRRLEIRDVLTSGSGVAVYPRSGKPLTADAAVIATGARLSRLAGRWLRVPVQAGHGYSFTVPVDRPIPGPIYLPDVRVACTPYKGAIRVSGTMEFRHPHRPGHTRTGGGHRRLGQSLAGRGALGRAQQHVGWCATRSPPMAAP